MNSNPRHFSIPLSAWYIASVLWLAHLALMGFLILFRAFSYAGIRDSIQFENVPPLQYAGLHYDELYWIAAGSGVTALFVHCHDLESTLVIWKALGLECDVLGTDMARVRVRGPMPANRLSLYFIADLPSPVTSYLDDPGIVCLSLLCRDAEHVRAELGDLGYFVSDCFSLSPFGHPLRMFFARNTDGETYAPKRTSISSPTE